MIAFSRGDTKFDAHPRREVAESVEKFIERIDKWRQPTKGQGYICAPFSDGHRCKDSAEPVRFFCPDFDRIAADRLADLCMWLAGFNGTGWQTHSSTPEMPRMRAVLMLDRPATRDEVLRIGAAFEAEAAELFGNAVKLDSTTWQTEQPAYLAPPGVRLSRYFGEPLPVDEWLARPTAKAPTDGATESVRERAAKDAERDPVLRELVKRDRLTKAVQRTPGWFNVLCPCDDKHEIDSGDSSAVYMLPNYGGRKFGRFHCLHHPCANRPQAEFIEALGLEPKAVWREQTEQIHLGPEFFGEGAGSDGTPQPLDIFRTFAAPALSPEDFPGAIRDYAAPLAQASGHDPSAYLMAMLAGAAAAASDGLRLLLDPDTSWFESARVWVLLLGAPGSAKTPAIRAAMAPLFDIHKGLREQHAREVAALGKDEQPPPQPSLYSSDPTVEALSDVLVANPRGIVGVFEELDSWLGSHDAYRSGGGSKDRGEWLRLFDGGPHQVDRIKRGSVFVPNWGCSILGATTPAGLKRHAKDLPPDGLIQRFLPVIVRPMGDPASSPGLRATIKPARERFEEALRALFAAQPGTVRLAPDAARLFHDRCRALRRETEAVGAMSEPMQGHIAKHAGLMARVALTMHALEHGEMAREVPLDADTMQRAERLLRAIARHALAMFDMLAGDAGSALALARAVGRAIVAGQFEDVTRHNLIQSCRAYRDASEPAREAALRFLVDAAWLTPYEAGRVYAGRPAAFAVHPAVHARFAAEGDALKARRGAVRDLFK